MCAARPRVRPRRVYPVPCNRLRLEPGRDHCFHGACAQEHSLARLSWVLSSESRMGKEAGQVGRCLIGQLRADLCAIEVQLDRPYIPGPIMSEIPFINTIGTAVKKRNMD